MLRGSLIVLSFAVLAASCSKGRERTAPAAQADTADPTTVLDLLDDQLCEIPADAPDELLTVPSWYRGRALTSLRAGVVTSAWTTAPSPDGTPSAMVYRCTRDGTGAFTWTASPEAWLVPLGVDPSAYPDLAPFTATVTTAQPVGFFFGGPSPASLTAFTLDASIHVGASPSLPSHSQLVGVEEATLPGAMPADLPLARIRKTSGSRMGPYADGTLDHADYVVRLHTDGGAGPGAGTTCAAGEAEVRDPFSADFYFVHMIADTGVGGSGGGGAGGGSSLPNGLTFGPPSGWGGAGATGPLFHFP